jgi:integrase
MRVPLAIGFFSGMRFSEVLGLRWSQVDLLANVITLYAGATKNDAGRTAPICAELRSLLVAQRAKRQAGCEFVCFRLDPKGHAEHIEGFRRAWYSGCCRAGLGRWVPVVDADGQPLFEKPRGPRSKPKQKREYVGRTFHDLRRSGAKAMLDAGIQEDTAMKIGGWKTKSMLTRYNVQSPKNIETAGKLLDAFNAKQAREVAENSHSLATVDGVSGESKTVN